MRFPVILPAALLAMALLLISGCAIGKKEWPSAVPKEDRFSLHVEQGMFEGDCLLLSIRVSGAVNRLWAVNVQYESVGLDEGDGCEGCPFMPRTAEYFARGQKGFDLNGNVLSVSVCGLNPDKQYRFRIAGENELSGMDLEYTEVFETLSQID